MKKCLLWGMGRVFNIYVDKVKEHERLQHFTVVGVTAAASQYPELRGYRYIKKSDLQAMEFDFVIIMADGKALEEIRTEILTMGIAEWRVLNYRILTLDNLDMDRYVRIKRNPPSIICHNCWGGYTYHSLGLRFTSPMINMFLHENDYMKLLRNPKQYMSEELQFVEMGYSEGLKKYYPRVKCGDIFLEFNHYDSFEDARKCWERRKSRIDWNNLFVMMYTQDIELAREFAKLPYEKKVCFVPFPSEDESWIYVDFRNEAAWKEQKFGHICNSMARGDIPYYDVLDLLEYGKFTKIVKTFE
ncbi:MAG: DUF1919 domain-containing protein [Lachnospiraceae bacterium]|nr:DUF1919 domain-containing protein [Lachnospiraceae bacterium]